jgi:hypothetical protein
MQDSSDQVSNNPFVRALRGSKNESDGTIDGGQSNGENKQPVAAATMEALSLGDRQTDSSGNENGFAANSSAKDVGTSPMGEGRMEAVVDLLFGNHLSEINASMRSLEKQIAERVNKAESEMRLRIESIDRHTKGEIDSLSKGIDKERLTRDDAVGRIGDRVDTTIRQMEMRLEKMEDEFARNQEMAQRDLDERLTKAADSTMLLRKAMEQEIANMKVSLSTRAELGTMFTELGKRLEANAGGSGLG